MTNKNYIERMVKKAVLGVAGIASLVSVSGVNCIGVNPVGLPSGTGRHVTLFESDLQDTPNKEMSFKIGEGAPGQYTGVSVESMRDKDGDFAPFNTRLESEGGLEENIPSKYSLVFEDNEREFVDGEQWLVRLQGISSDRSVDLYFHNILDSPPEIVRVTYRKGHSNPNLEDQVGGAQPPFVTGDGVCDSVNGENHANSPDDCALPYTVGDGFCDAAHGESIDNSPDDCAVPPTPGCEDECVYGATECVDGGVRTCGDFDADPCTEWSAPVACDSGYECDSGNCVPTPPTELERLADWACSGGLPRAMDDPATTTRDEGDDTRLYFVTPEADGTFSYVENFEIDPYSPESNGGIIKHVVPAGDTGNRYLVATGGTSHDPIDRMESGLSGVNPCPEIYVFNPDKEGIPNAVFSDTVYRADSTESSEQIRGIVP